MASGATKLGEAAEKQVKTLLHMLEDIRQVIKQEVVPAELALEEKTVSRRNVEAKGALVTVSIWIVSGNWEYDVWDMIIPNPVISGFSKSQANHLAWSVTRHL